MYVEDLAQYLAYCKLLDHSGTRMQILLHFFDFGILLKTI